jgi:hypothetical protein
MNFHAPFFAERVLPVLPVVRPETNSPSGDQPPRLSGGRKRAADI